MINIIFLVGTPLVTGMGVWLALCRFGFSIDGKINSNLKKKTFQLFDGASRTNWPEVFISLFDRVFSSGGSGRPELWRSALASCISLTVVTAICVVNQISSNGAIFSNVELSWALLVILFPYVVAINVIGDHFSLWQTRYVLGWMIGSRSSIYRLLLLVLDVIASALIYFSAVVLGSALFLGIWVLSGGEISYFGERSWVHHLISMTGGVFSSTFRNGGLTLSDPEGFGNFFAVLMYTTLFTSVWVWTFLAGIIILPLFTRLWNVFKVEESPVGAAMCTGGAAIGLVTFVLIVVRTLAEKLTS